MTFFHFCIVLDQIWKPINYHYKMTINLLRTQICAYELLSWPLLFLDGTLCHVSGSI